MRNSKINSLTYLVMNIVLITIKVLRITKCSYYFIKDFPFILRKNTFHIFKDEDFRTNYLYHIDIVSEKIISWVIHKSILFPYSCSSHRKSLARWATTYKCYTLEHIFVFFNMLIKFCDVTYVIMIIRKIMVELVCISELFNDFIYKPRCKSCLFQAETKPSTTREQVNHFILFLL